MQRLSLTNPVPTFPFFSRVTYYHTGNIRARDQYTWRGWHWLAVGDYRGCCSVRLRDLFLLKVLGRLHEKGWQQQDCLTNSTRNCQSVYSFLATIPCRECCISNQKYFNITIYQIYIIIISLVSYTHLLFLEFFINHENFLIREMGKI